MKNSQQEFEVRIISSKYKKRVGKIYRGAVIDGTPKYFVNSLEGKQLKCTFQPIYNFNSFIHMDTTKNVEVGEVNPLPIEEPKIKTVRTITGKTVPLEKAVKIGIYWYQINKDVVVLDNGEYELANKAFFKCQITNQIYPISRAKIVVIDRDDENNALITGLASVDNKSPKYPLIHNLKLVRSNALNEFISSKKELGKDVFGSPVYDSVFIVNLDRLLLEEMKSNLSNSIKKNLITSEEVLKKIKAFESLKHGVFFLDQKLVKEVSIPEYRKFNQKASKEDVKTKQEGIDLGVTSPTFVLTGNFDYTFGVEFETSSGTLPEYAANGLNVECMRDGSIPSGEYVTGVLKGDAGVQQLNKLMYELSRRCTIDSSCGVHVHIGSAKFTKMFSIAAYCLSQMLYEPMLFLMAPYRRDNRYCTPIPDLGIKSIISAAKGNYTPENIQKLYINIFKFLCDGENMAPSDFNEEYPALQPHKMGRGWGRAPRYTWLNLIPCNFVRADRHNNLNTNIYKDNRLANTIEFRLHHGSLYFTETYYWLLLCMAYTAMCETSAEKILNDYVKGKSYTISDLIDVIAANNANPVLINNLDKFVTERVKNYHSAKDSDFIKNKLKTYSPEMYKNYVCNIL